MTRLLIHVEGETEETFVFEIGWRVWNALGRRKTKNLQGVFE